MPRSHLDRFWPEAGKITELAVRDVVMGREVTNKGALANPEALEIFRRIEELRN